MATPKIDPLDKPLRGAEEISEFLDESLTRTKYKLAKGRLAATKIGKIWYSTPRRLLNQFGGGPS